MLPPEFREIISSRSEDGKFVLTTYDNCIFGYSLPDFLELEQRYAGVSTTNNGRNFQRLLIGGAEFMTADAQGRVRLSKSHLLYAGITSEAVLLGQSRRFELWNPERLDRALNVNFDEMEQGFDVAL